MFPVETPFKVFTGLDGKPLNNGYVYFGVANQNPITSPISVYWDSAGTQPALQPLRTENGYIMHAGTPANVFVASAYSELVKDHKGRQVFYARTSDDFSVLAIILAFIISLASSIGASLIGFIQAGVNAVLRTAQDKMRERVSVLDFGADPTGVVSSSAAILAAQNYLLSVGGGTMYFPPGQYKVTTPIIMAPGITYMGAMRAGLGAYNAGRSRLFSSTSNIFNNSAITITEVCIRDLFIESEVGGGHIFDWSLAGVVAKIEMSGVCLAQRNAAKSVINGKAAGGVFSIWMHDFEYVYVPACVVPPIWIASPTVNSIAIENFWSTSNGQSAVGNPSIWVESTNPGGAAFNIGIKQGVFELPGSGSIRLLSCTNSVIEQCGVYDLSIAPGYYQFSVDKGATGPASSNVTIRDCRSTVGTVGVADVFLNMSVGGQGSFQIEGSTFSVLDGAVAGGAYIGIKNSAITTIQNLNYIDMNAGPEANLTFKSTTAAGATVSLWNGYAGNRDGALNIKVNTVHSGSISKNGVLSWGTAYITQLGVINAGAQIYPGTPAGAQQVVAGLLGNAGIPNNAQGNNGDFYFRSDGAALTTIYQRRAGIWVGIV